MKSIFTTQYPGTPRISLSTNNGDAVIKFFTDKSVRSHSTVRGNRMGLSGGMYPIDKKIVFRGDMMEDDFMDKVMDEAAALAKKHHCQVWDAYGKWGFAEKERIKNYIESSPFNDELEF